MTTQHVEPLDPDSPRGRQVAAELTTMLAEISLAIAERKRRREQAEASGREPAD